MTIGGSFRHYFRPDCRPGSRPVLNHYRLTQAFTQFRCKLACQNIGSAPCTEWNDQAHRSRRVRLRSRSTRKCRRQCSNGRREIEKLSANKFHFASPRKAKNIRGICKRVPPQGTTEMTSAAIVSTVF